uniref:Zinc finger, CCHC-type n=1 Tax=Tanacetum cinerariifolium TaxID=118510 RepID=A0A6L2PC61_TANCI|nr:hypothetical protein [Tanacetum cinerariifolium]
MCCVKGLRLGRGLRFEPYSPETSLRVTLGRLLPHARGLGFKLRRGGFPSGAKKKWGLSPKAKVRVLHTAQLDVTIHTSLSHPDTTVDEGQLLLVLGFFEKQKLTGFIDWYRQLKIVLSVKDKLDYLEQPIPPTHVPAQVCQQVSPEALAAHATWVEGLKEIELKTMFAQQAEEELLKTVRDFHSCKQEEGKFVSSYVLKMKSYIDNLERLGHPVSLNLGLRFIMDDPNINMEEYIRLEEEKAQRHGRTFNWQTVTYGKMEYCKDKDDSFMNFETKYPVIVFDDTSNATLLCKPRVSPLNNNKIDFKISFDESEDEDYMVIFNKNSFSFKIIYVHNFKMDSKNDNDKVNMPSFPSPEPTVSYFDDLDFLKDFEKEFSAIVYNDTLTSKLDFLTEPTDAIRRILGFGIRRIDLLYIVFNCFPVL